MSNLLIGSLLGSTAAQPLPTPATDAARVYRLELVKDGHTELHRRFEAAQLALLEKLNRRDREHLARLDSIVVPDRWDLDELAYSPLPAEYPAVAAYEKFFVVHQPAQVFGAYANGRLVRWGPVSTGRRSRPTPDGLFHLNWRSPGRHSTVDAEWFMRWYFNFHNRQGLSLHEYELPGYPASHACVRLLARDARWLFDWGEEWQLSADGVQVVQPGTPVLIIGRYAFDQPPPWRATDRSHERIVLPPITPAPSDGAAGPP